ncbi:carbohydrate kinase family protein [Patescibacteria group bacterium]
MVAKNKKPPKILDCIAIGDTTLDVFLKVNDSGDGSETCHIDKDNKLLCFGLGDKIPVEKLTYVPAVGNAANHAFGVKRLGLSTAIYSYLGNDVAGQQSLEVFKEEGINTDYMQTVEGATNYSTVINNNGERTILVYHEHRNYDLPEIPPARFAYFSSLAAGHEELHKDIPEYVKKYDVKLGFNPGSFQLREGVDVLRPILGATHVLFVNRDEAQTLVGKSDDIKTLTTHLHELGPEIVAITDGKNGSYASDGGRVYFLDIFEAPLVERTGAGDSYASGFIGALAHGHDIKEAMRWGTVNSASVIQYIGAREGLLKKEDIESTLAKHMSFQPNEI